MSRRLINRSPDLTRLQNEGYDLEVNQGHLLVRQVPYRNQAGELKRGMLVSPLDVADDITVKPGRHEVYFAGEAPHGSNGEPMTALIGDSQPRTPVEGVRTDHMFSQKPSSGYADYHHKMTTYINILLGPARSVDPEATPTTFPLIEDDDEDSVFKYIDTASSRAGISVVADKLRIGKVAIIGLGGTGSYILDMVAKTPVREIHLFDGDRFIQHNAFRSPGAASGETLATVPKKVNYFADMYSMMREGVIPHDDFVDETNVEELRETDFVFLALDNGAAKKLIIERLEEYGVPFIDVGMGVQEVDGALLGLVRTTTSTSAKRDHVHQRRRIPFSDGNVDNDYNQNIQIADLNALNAALAVIKWKKQTGFYHDHDKEHYSVYAIIDNSLINEDQV